MASKCTSAGYFCAGARLGTSAVDQFLIRRRANECVYPCVRREPAAESPRRNVNGIKPVSTAQLGITGALAC